MQPLFLFKHFKNYICKNECKGLFKKLNMYPKLFKRFLLMICIVTFCCLNYQTSFSFSIVRNIPPHSVTNNSSDYLKASIFITLTVKDFETATGQKLNFFQKIYFKLLQKQVKHDLKRNPDFLVTDYDKAGKPKFKFNSLWFVIGAFIGPLGVLLAYTDKQKKTKVLRKDKIKSVWLGFIIFIIWFGTFFIF